MRGNPSSSLVSQPAAVVLAFWLGLTTQLSAQTTNWFAFNDHNLNSLPAPTTGPNVTTYHLGMGPGGPLTNNGTGELLAATLMVMWTGGDGPDNFGASNDPNVGTPAYNLFNGIVDVGGSGAGVDEGIVGLRSSEMNVVTLTFSNLDAGKKYAFRGTSVRGNNYNDRWAYYTLQGAISFVDAHVDGSANQNIFTAATFPSGTLTSGEVALNSGENRVGSLVGWNDIVPAADGTFSIAERQYTGPAPFGNPSAGPYGYGMNAILLAEVETGPPAAPAITQQPLTTTVTERAVASLHVDATGTALRYQWYMAPSTPIPGATKATYAVTNRMGGWPYPWSTPMDNGTYYVIISGTLPPAVESAHVVVTVNPDVTAPTLVRALCGPGPDQMTLTLSEPLNNATLEATDQFLWEIRTLDDAEMLPLSDLPVYIDDGVSRTMLFTATGRDPTKAYKVVRVGVDLARDTAKLPNFLATGASVPILCFTNELLALDASWRYNDTGADLGPAWYTGPDSSLPSTGVGLFDAKRAAAPPDSRAAITNGLPVGTCTTLSNTTTLVLITNHFFRTHFNFSGSPAQVLLQMETYNDDGAIVYLNGSVLQNLGMPTGPLNNVSLAARSHDPDREVFLYPAPALLHVGDNVIAAQVAQNGAGSSDITWGCRISVIQATPPSTQTIVTIAYAAGHPTISWTPAGGILQFKHNLSDANWTDIGAVATPYTDLASPADHGFYQVKVP